MRLVELDTRMLTRTVERSGNTHALHLPKKNNRRVAVALVLSFIGLLVGLFVAFPRQFVHQVEISIVRQPTPYTQLFFNNPTALPSQLRVNRANEFAFTIVNDQGRSWLYRYTVTASTTGSSTVAGRGSLTIRNGRSLTFTVAVVPKLRKSRYLVTVALDTPDQSIDFYGDTP
jgi:hypothetical protein